jgi:hypothetical protein
MKRYKYDLRAKPELQGRKLHKKKLKIRVQIFMDLVYHVEHLVGKPMQSDADTVFQVCNMNRCYNNSIWELKQ